MKTIREILLSLVLTICPIGVCQAACATAAADSAVAEESLDDELRTPVIEKRQQTFVRTYMKNIAETLYRQGYDIETMRSGEVVIAVIPTDELFFPNDSTLMPSASKTLDRFLQFFTPDRRYKMVLAVHSDDTGSEEYLFNLTRSRVDSILDYYESKGADVSEAVGFPMGDSDPVTDNSTRVARSANRRLEIYIVPDEGLIKLAKDNR